MRKGEFDVSFLKCNMALQKVTVQYWLNTATR